MGKKAVKSARKFANSGQLKATIQARRKHQDIRRKQQGKQQRKGGKGRQGIEHEDEDDGEDEDVEPPPASKKGKSKVKSVDDLLSGAFMDDASDDEAGDVGDDVDEDEDEDEDDVDDNESFASVDDLEDEGEAHMQELTKLAEKDPEFFKYLQDNDQELLNFDTNADVEDEDMDDPEGVPGSSRAPALTSDILRQWQKALLQQNSLRALRKLLIAFRSAAHMNEEGEGMMWSIDSSAVYSKLVITALRYTPVVLEHHVPYKTLPDGRFKTPTQSPKQKTLTKLVLSFFYNIVHMMEQISDPELLKLAITESARLVPYVITSRKAIKLYLKALLSTWSSGEDSIRISAIVAIRRLCMSTDNSIMDTVYKALYLTLVRSSKQTTAYSLPSVTLMKNSASEIYCLSPATAYQHAFGYIRQLAIHLRNSMKVKTKEAYKQVYNWQYVHSIDFWSLVLARACESSPSGTENELKPLIYPLVQVALGAIKLVSASRSYPFHFHLIRSLIHLMAHTHVYVPISPYLLPAITATLSATAKSRASTLKPLDMDTSIRAPQQYLKTRVYSEEIAEEANFLLGEWLATPVVQGSIAFPEIIVPVTVTLRKAIKASKGGKGKGPAKEAAIVKTLVERVDESAKWMDARRRTVSFAPAQIDQVAAWERGLNIEESPLVKFVKVQRKVREKRRRLLEKGRKGEDEILEE